jgi:hypothetical protein
MDLMRSMFRPQVECEVRCAQSQDLRAASLVHLAGLEPAILFLFPLTVSSPTVLPPSKIQPFSSPPAYRWPDLSVASQVPVS